MCQAHKNAQACMDTRLVKMHAGPDSLDNETEQDMEENNKEKEEREKATPKHKLHNFTLSPYFIRKKTGIPESSPALAWVAIRAFQPVPVSK